MHARLLAPLTLLALVAALLALPAVVLAPSAAADEPVSSVDFDDGTTGAWTQSGSPTLGFVDDGKGGQALSVGNRTNDYDGVQSPTGLLRRGGTYRFSVRVRLADGATGPARLRFVVKPAYTWVADTAVPATGWTTVTGTWTVPVDADESALQVYLGTDAGAAGGYVVDDLAITRVTDAGPWEPTPDPDFVPGGAVAPTTTPVNAARGTGGSGNVAALTFDDGPNPGETERLLDVLAEHDVTATFCVIGQNVQAPGGAEILRRIVAEGHTLCNHSTDYADLGSATEAEVETRLKANLAIIREALGDPDAPVPYFRAPNGSFGRTGAVAAALGMQPLGLGNVIYDWDGNPDRTAATLSTNLRGAIAPGAIALVHDGGGDRQTSVDAVETVLPEKLAAGWTFTLPQGGATGPTGPPAGGPVLQSDFEDGLDGWEPRSDGNGAPTVARTTEVAHSGTASAAVTGRNGQGDGIGHDLTGLLEAGRTYEISLWVRFLPGQTADDVWLSMQRTSGGTDSFDTVEQLTGVRNDGWTELRATYQAPAADAFRMYVETAYPDGGTGSFAIDDVLVQLAEDPVVQDLTPLQETTDFPVGVAIDQRETTGPAADLLTRHFGQITPENHMKPEAWYAPDGTFTPHPQADALMRFAQDEGLRMYGHTLVWHSQTPAFFFQRDDGTPLTTSAADQQVLRDRMRAHIDHVAEHLATTYGPFGSATNPLVAFDVVNEVVSDSSEHADGMRRSEWYRVLGEEFVDLAFTYADEAFNSTYAAPGTDRPVTLFINDYNTEQPGKGARLHALVERLLDRGVPVDGVGHQFHVSLSFPVDALGAAIDRFADLPVTQAVTELDVTTGTPVTEALLVDQGYYYRDAFAAFRERSERIFSVTVWGLTDGRSWRASSGDPLLFDDGLQAKPAYYGAAGADLEPPQRSALAFQAELPLEETPASAAEWARLPQLRIDEGSGFGVRWSASGLTVRVAVTDPDVQPTDAVTVVVGEEELTVPRSGGTVVDDGYVVTARLPLPAGSAVGDVVPFDVGVVDDGTSAEWAGEAVGSLTLVEALSSTETLQAPASAVPAVDGRVDPVWTNARSFSTVRQVSGTGGATARVRTLWRGSTLYAIAEVTDPELDDTGSDPWTQDSVEFFLDAGNAKAGPYRYDDMQLRVSYRNVLSFGTGDEAFHRARVTSATRTTDDGYVVEVALGLLESGGPGTHQGLDVQVNDAAGGARASVRAWADPTGLGYQTTARWGVARLSPTVVGVPAPPVVKARPRATLQAPRTGVLGRLVRLRGTVTARPSLPAGTRVTVQRRVGAGAWRAAVTVVVPRSGSWSRVTRLPRRTGPVRFRVLVPGSPRLERAVSAVRVVRVVRPRR